MKFGAPSPWIATRVAGLLCLWASLWAAPESSPFDRSWQSQNGRRGGAPTYSRDIAPILSANCISCHQPGEIGPFSLTTFDQVRQRGSLIAEATGRRYMPPWKPVAGVGGPFDGERRLTGDQIDALSQWVEAGMPEGSPSPPPARVAPASRWRLGAPDLVVTIPEPYIVAADGADVFRTFVMPIPVGAAKFVAAVEFSPGSNRSAHHANVRFDSSPASRDLDAQDPLPGYEGAVSARARYPDGYFFGWTPGQSPLLSLKGMAWRLAPGTDLVVQLHLRKTGKAERVQPAVAFYFTEEAPRGTPLAIRLGRQNIDMAPGEQYVLSDSYRLPADVELHAIHPHAHYRATTIRATADLPDGTRRWLLRIDDWDFNWQDVYRYTTPLALPGGTTITMTYTYDNSTSNVRNPDSPPRRVVFGQGSTDEMGDLWLQVVSTSAGDRAMLSNDIRRKVLAEDAVGYNGLLAADPDNAGYHSDLGFLQVTLGRYDPAVAHYEAAARLKPDWAAAHYNLATLLAAMGRLDEAVARFRQAVALRPGHAESHNNLGAVLLAQGRIDEAVEHAERAVALDPANAEARSNLERARAAKR